ncbi:hypothetical protein OAA57_00785 [bacterium]|jgi:hypothetical protein|nr:hypothetical protein [bacterium]MDB4350097.1 hypothetical protein [bacterium]
METKHMKIQGSAMWAKVMEPDTKFVPEGQYTIKVVMPVTEAAELCEQLDSYATQKLAQVVKEQPKLKAVLSTTPAYTTEYDEDGNDTGNVTFNCKLKAVQVLRDGTKRVQKPFVCDSKVKPINPDTLIGNGSKVIVKVQPNPYMMPATKTVGVSLKMLGVQVIDLVEYGMPTTNLFDEEDGYITQAVVKDDNQEMFNDVDDTADAKDQGDF